MDVYPEAYAGANRFGELSKLLPVSAVMLTIVFLYTQYVLLHCLRLLQLDLPASARATDDVRRGMTHFVAFHAITGLLLYCLVRCILTYPGTIPNGRGWDLVDPDTEQREEGSTTLSLIEKKATGDRRHCKWCLKYKPDRCHHCRICNLCVLRMDHHCPWVYNCIGFRNHKYFFLLLVYADIDLIFICSTMFDTLWWSTRIDVSMSMMLTLALGETFATFLMVLTTMFLGFHIWLMLMAMTTVEFCEKSLKKASYNSSVFSKGPYSNICAVLGEQPLLWLVPISLPRGDGLAWDDVDVQSSGSASRIPAA
jgi:hypothetical protein